jgi:hypothetical protein
MSDDDITEVSPTKARPKGLNLGAGSFVSPVRLLGIALRAHEIGIHLTTTVVRKGDHDNQGDDQHIRSCTGPPTAR